MDKERYIVRDLHTLKIVRVFEKKEYAKDFCKDIQKRKRNGEIINGVYLAIK